MKTFNLPQLVFIATFAFTLFNCQNIKSTQEKNQSLIKEAQKARPLIDNSKEAKLNIPYRSLDTSKIITSFGFGSGADQNKPQPFWSLIYQKKPDLFIMMGDNVYASTPENKPIIDQYIKLNNNEDYLKLREAIPFLAIWNDHDFGQINGGNDNPDKDEARKVFLNYWSYLKHTLPENQKSIYHSRIVGSKKQTVQFIVLDTRWDRDPLIKNPAYISVVSGTEVTAPTPLYLPHTEKSKKILSQEQWVWLEKELRKPASLKFVVTSTQLIPHENGYENWGLFPHEREKFLTLVKKLGLKNLILLSGDRQFATSANAKKEGLPYLYEITSSSLNHPLQTGTIEKDSSYVNDPITKPNYAMAYINWLSKKVKVQTLSSETNEVLNELEIKF